jgi:hypothetical protein
MNSIAMPLPTASSPTRVPARAFGTALAPEYELLLACAQPALDGVAAARIEELVHQGLDWQKLTRLAMSHGLSPLVYTRLEPVLPRPLPDAFADLKRDAARLVQHALIHTAEMKRLIPSFKANGIETVVYKGPALATSLYGRIALRPFLDLDLLVQPQDVERAWSLLVAQGYELPYRISGEQLPAFMQAGNHLPLYRENQCVELHWNLFARTRATTFDTRGAWSRRVPLVVQGTTVMTLAPSDLAHFLCLHGNKHVWCRLAWLTDLMWFMRRYPQFDWDALLESAQERGTLRMVLVGLLLASELFDSPLPAPVARRMEGDTHVPAIAKWMWERVLDGNQDLPTGRELYQLVMRTRERRRDRGRDLYHHFMALRPDDLQAAHRFTPMSAGYRLHRLWYLVNKYALVRIGRARLESP